MNRLKDSASAYLLQHAQDPVHWYPWGAEAFERARNEGKPVFISIGYAACHWCHVMARESFRDFGVASTLNDHFVSIKVDREEHPQVDERYMSATQMMTGQGGWPMTIFALPNGEVFYAGTYFPPEPRQGMPSFTQLLDSIIRVWSTGKDQLVASAQKITRALNEEMNLNQRILTAELPGPDINELFGENLGWQQLSQIVEKLVEQEDLVNGGFGPTRGPKFPPLPTIGFLNSFLAAEFSAPADPEIQSAFDQARFKAEGIQNRLLEKMALGAIYDHAYGGFFRYTVDAKWQLPHFEKMLFDNAYLLEGYAIAAGQSDDELFADTARGTAHWMIDNLQLPGGGFASSLDADSEVAGHHVEGGYYIFSDLDLKDASLKLQAEQVIAELRNGVAVSETPETIEELSGAKTISLKSRPSAEQLKLWRNVMRATSEERESDPTFLIPDRDAKVVASWNAQSVLALLKAHEMWPSEGFADSALQAAEYLWQVHVLNNKLARISFEGTAGEVEGTLGDYSQTIRSFLAVHRFEGTAIWWERALRVNELLHQRLVSEDVIREIAKDDIQSENLGALVRDDYWASPLDDTEPSGASRYVLSQWEMNVLKGESQLESDHVTRLVAFGVTSGSDAVSHLGGMLQSAVRLLMPPRTLLIRGQADNQTKRIHQWAQKNNYLPVVIDSFGGGAPIAEQASAMEPGPLLLRCTGSVCLMPLTHSDELPARV